MAMMALTQLTALAQQQDTPTDSRVNLEIGASVLSSYVWRGLELGSVSFQPVAKIAYKGFSLSAEGNVGLTNTADHRELDLTATYTVGGLNIGITDYWAEGGRDPENRYFRYNAHSTNHTFEANIGYNFGVASVQAYTYFAGDDGYNKNGKRAYSSYLEVDVPFRMAGFDCTATAAAVPWATTSYKTTGFAVTGLAVKAEKEIKVTDTFSVPAFAQIYTNPSTQHAYLIFGITLHP